MESEEPKRAINPVFARTRKAILQKLGDPAAHVNKKPTNFVLVHEGGHGAWCWYKLADLLQKSGHTAIVFDLAASGLHPTRPDHISSLQQYAEPLLEALRSISDSEKVVLVGHGLGGMCLAYASEIFASKIAVAVYLAALMLPGGFESLERHMNKIETQLIRSNASIYSINLFSKDSCRDILYNTSPSQDIQLACTLLRPVPSALSRAKAENVTDKGYGCVRRVYIKTTKDRAFPVGVQDTMIKMNPPHRVLSLNCDHSPFFSAAPELHRMLLGISVAYGR